MSRLREDKLNLSSHIIWKWVCKDVVLQRNKYNSRISDIKNLSNPIHVHGLVNNTAYILCNNLIILKDFEGQLMGLILNKGPSTNPYHYWSENMVNIGHIWFECDDVKITKIEFKLFCNSNNTVYILFYKTSIWWKQLKDIKLVPMDAICWVNWEEGIETLYSQVPPEDLSPLFMFIHFYYLCESFTFVFCYF